MRVMEATKERPEANAGRTQCFQLSVPEAGKSLNWMEKQIISIRASQKFGIAAKSKEKKGTIRSRIGVGRVIAVFNHFYFHKTAVLAGLQLS